MSNPTVKPTYTLDASTTRKFEEIAHQWGVSKSEALKRVLKSAAVNGHRKESGALRALNLLQGSLGLTATKARAWARKVRAERRTTSSTQESRR